MTKFAELSSIIVRERERERERERDGSRLGIKAWERRCSFGAERGDRSPGASPAYITSSNPCYSRGSLSNSYECKLCLTLHNNEGNYLAHTQGKRHQTNLAKRAAREAKDAPTQPQPHKRKERLGRGFHANSEGLHQEAMLSDEDRDDPNPDFKAIKKRTEDLITRDYLERDKDNPNLFRYLA
ncbi:hypothetical protein IEQ34_011651 [Dendrobium chrysotoxum]|uniref:Matrin-type domain-containing protein n=1 Tax=Dendrobium chrysotoxum TaxID=161865 RepID=A0AAV7GTF9_DENCH|nr:hypothetical protein IEQ34_011651 [Dendrobium chrysotoxum]